MLIPMTIKANIKMNTSNSVFTLILCDDLFSQMPIFGSVIGSYLMKPSLESIPIVSLTGDLSALLFS